MSPPHNKKQGGKSIPHVKRHKKPSKMEVASKHGVSRTTLYSWKAKGIDIEDEGAILEATEAKRGDSEDIKTARLGVLRETERKLKLANDQRQGQLIEVSEVKKGQAIAMQTLDSEHARLERDMPSILVGLTTEMEIRLKIKEWRDSIRPRLTEAFQNYE